MKKDLIFYFSVSLLSKLISGISLLILARYFSKLEFGLLRTTLSLVGLIFIFVNYGLSDLFLYRFSKNKNKKLFSIFFSGFSLNYLISIAFLLISGFFIEIKLFILTMIFFIKSFFDWIFDISFKYFQSLNKFNKLSIALLLQSLPVLLSTLFVILTKANVFAYSIVFLFFTIIIVFIFILFFRLNYLFNINFNIYKNLKFFKSSHVFFISTFMSYIYMQSDILMLSFLKGYKEVARYSVITTIIMSIYLFPTILYNYYLPKLTETFKNISIYKKFLKTYLITNFIIVFTIFTVFILFAKEILVFLYTEKYIDSLNIFKALLFVFFFHGIVFVFASILTSTGNQRLRSKVQVLAAFTNIALNLIFIPLYGAEGAAFTTAITEVIIFSLYLYFSKRVLS